MFNRKTKNIIYLFGTLIIPALSIAILFLIKGNFSYKNGFNRKITPARVVLLSKIKNNNNFTEICGYSKNSIYFANLFPGKIFLTDKNLRGSGTFTVPLHNNKIASRFETQVDSPEICLFAGNVPAVYLSRTNSPSAVQILYLPAIYGRSVLINAGNLLFRIVQKNKGKLNMVFAAYTLQNQSLQYERGVSELNGDVGFSTDGLLHYDSAVNLAVYVEFYRNRITAFDTNFNVAYRSHTIDTVSRNPTNYNAMKIGGFKEYTNNSPKRLVNLESCVDQGFLYVQSELRADNEQPYNFAKNSVIDIYTVKDGRYRESFYIPEDDGGKLYKFRVFGNLLVVLYKDHIAAYHINK